MQSSDGRFMIDIVRDDATLTDIRALRRTVFCEEIGTPPETLAQDPAMDAIADHLIVRDLTTPEHRLIGAYRVIRSNALPEGMPFLTESEFDITPLKTFPGVIAEFSRSCIAAEHRNGRVIQLLWRAISAYVTHYDVGLLFGCASFVGTDPTPHAEAMGYLAAHHLAPEPFRPTARANAHRVTLTPRPEVEMAAIFPHLPPLIKGYLRAGTWIGQDAMIDPDFNTTDVCIVLPRERIADRYRQRFMI
jgi:putative hemolysin